MNKIHLDKILILQNGLAFANRNDNAVSLFIEAGVII